MSDDNAGLPPGFTPAWEWTSTPEGVVEFEHPLGEQITADIEQDKRGPWSHEMGRYLNEPPCGAPKPGTNVTCSRAKQVARVISDAQGNGWTTEGWRVNDPDEMDEYRRMARVAIATVLAVVSVGQP